MIPLAPTAADTNHHGTAGFISVGSFQLPRLLRDQTRTRGFFL